MPNCHGTHAPTTPPSQMSSPPGYERHLALTRLIIHDTEDHRTVSRLGYDSGCVFAVFILFVFLYFGHSNIRQLICYILDDFFAFGNIGNFEICMVVSFCCVFFALLLFTLCWFFHAYYDFFPYFVFTFRVCLSFLALFIMFCIEFLCRAPFALIMFCFVRSCLLTV